MYNQLLLFYLIVFYITKTIKVIPYITIILFITVKNQLTVFVIFNFIKKNLISLTLFLLSNLKKISIFVLKKKINKSLFFTKIMILHITVLGVLICWLAFRLNLICLFAIPINIQFILILFNFLGIYWSTQENLWGGAWDWNLIEVSILVVIVYIIFYLHNKNNFIYNEQLIVIVFIMYLIYNHLPIILNIHSFTNNKLTKYTFIFSLFLISSFYIKQLNSVTILLFIIWVLQIFKIQNPNTLIKLIITTLILYILICYIKINIIWTGILLFYINITFTLIPTKKSPGYSFLSIIHNWIVYITIIIIFYQGTWYVPKYQPLLNYNKINVKNTQFISTNQFFVKKHQLNLVTNVKLALRNGYIRSIVV